MNADGSIVCTLGGRLYKGNVQAGAGTDEHPHTALFFESLQSFMMWYAQGGEASATRPKMCWCLSSRPLQLLAHGSSFLLLLDSGIVHKLAINGNDVQTSQPQGRAPQAFLPETINGLENVLIEKTAAGTQYAATLSRQGKLYIWSGQSRKAGDLLASLEFAQSGLATRVTSQGSNIRSVPGILDVAVGSSHIAVVSTDHRLFLIGKNDQGQLGFAHDQPSSQQYYPNWIEIKHPKEVYGIVCAPNSTIALATPKAALVSEYDEDEIIELVSSVYRTAIRMGMFEDHEVTFAPPQGHEIDSSQLEDASDLDPRCISLMRRLPYAVAGYRCVILDMECVDYRRPDIMHRTRYIDHPVMLTPGPEHQWLERKARSVDMFLFHGREGNDPSLVLDIENSMPPILNRHC